MKANDAAKLLEELKRQHPELTLLLYDRGWPVGYVVTVERL